MFCKSSIVPGRSPVLNFGIGSKPVWIHFSVDNPGAAALHRRLSIENAWFDRVEVYFQQQGRTTASYQPQNSASPCSTRG